MNREGKASLPEIRGSLFGGNRGNVPNDRGSDPCEGVEDQESQESVRIVELSEV